MAAVTQRMRILHAMAVAEGKAWDALSRYKFLMFGYHAAQWVTLSHLINPHPANPFVSAVIVARKVSGWPAGKDDPAATQEELLAAAEE